MESHQFESLLAFWTEVSSTTNSEDTRQIALESIELWTEQRDRALGSLAIETIEAVEND